MAILVFYRDGEVQLQTPLKGPRVVIGRSAEVDITIPHLEVSRQHCAVLKEEEGHRLVDLSGRGTTLHDRVVDAKGTLLREGDRILFGPLSIAYQSEETSPRASGLRLLNERETLITGSSTLFRNLALNPGSGKTQVLSPAAPLGSPRGSTTPAQLSYCDASGQQHVQLPSQPGFSLTFGSAPATLGRVQLCAPYISADHFRISHRPWGWLVEDLDSTNGTWLNELRLGACTLPASARIRAGETLLDFHESSSLAASGESLPGMVSGDPVMRSLLEFIRQVAPTRAPALIQGETGSGKEVVAFAIHQLSQRREAPFVAINCGAIARNTVESELFGHEKGAFTGADRTRMGAFEEADGGSLFLDEVGDLPLPIQVKLLRVLERGELRRLGGNKTISVDVRILSATHVDLRRAVEEGRFREDLYYRLCVVPLNLPPLRKRPGDIFPLAQRFLSQLCPNLPPKLSPAAREKLESHPWPGNARELRNVIQMALLLRRGGEIEEADIRFQPSPRAGISGSRTSKGSAAVSLGELSFGEFLAGKTLGEIEREAIRLALERHQGKRSRALSELGIPRSTFFRKLEEYGLSGELEE